MNPMLDELMQMLGRDGKIDVLVRVRPHAARSQLVGILDDGSLKIDIAAPAEDGRGNTALAGFVAGLFGVPPTRIKILSGKAARLKLVRVQKN